MIFKKTGLGPFLALLLSALVFAGAGGKLAADEHGYTVVSAQTLAAGDVIPAPTGRKVLAVSGNISGANMGGAAVFDMATLESIGVVRFTTETAWSEKPITFDGVLLSAILDVIGADSGATTLKVTALNDYAIEVPIADAREWPTILALKADGEYMSVREKGPLWLVYPRHMNAQFGNDTYNARWIWQIATIEVQ
ncbi:MAG: molybdopterin-dependent oxidoreductase [Proteobacteria bacterium]|nr:molybdopterin-dependent oxidoreductase [Pseudomonadota bacterium]MDA1356636.1 molybdopterin-dependent oxidoreductase [Pseudomonadota bacterium]